MLGLHDCDMKDIQKVNRSVADMVDKVTSLEVVLKSKLDLVIPILEECEKKMPKADHVDC